MTGTTAYVPQSPFILGGTVRENILFGRQYEEEPYNTAVQAAQLGPDLAQLPAGDMTELGECVGDCVVVGGLAGGVLRAAEGCDELSGWGCKFGPGRACVTADVRNQLLAAPSFSVTFLFLCACVCDQLSAAACR